MLNRTLHLSTFIERYSIIKVISIQILVSWVDAMIKQTNDIRKIPKLFKLNVNLPEILSKCVYSKHKIVHISWNISKECTVTYDFYCIILKGYVVRTNDKNMKKNPIFSYNSFQYLSIYQLNAGYPQYSIVFAISL